MSLPNLSILGIDPELVEQMDVERRKPPKSEQKKRGPNPQPPPPFSIGEDIPLLTSKRDRYPFQHMAVGQHFFVENRPNRSSKQTQNSVTNCVAHVKRVTGMKFQQQRCENGVRVWRIL